MSFVSQGNGDEHCTFKLSEHGGHVVLESLQAPGTHVGIRENGDAKKPSKTGTRKHARFTPINKRKALDGDSPLLAVFKAGCWVKLTSRSSEKSLRIMDGQVNGLGGKGKKAAFYVHIRQKDIVALQNVKDPNSWLRIRNNQLEGTGKGGRFCEFKVQESDGYITLESLVEPGCYVGVDSEGAVTAADQTDDSSENAHFTPSIKPRKAGETELLSMFRDDNIIVLESRASGKTLRFRGGDVEGIGGHGALARFKVHVKGPGVVTLQNKKEPRQWLKIKGEEITSNGGGGLYCELNVQEVDDHVVLESVMFPGTHVGVRDNGDVKPPHKTGKGRHGQFTPIVKDEAGDEDED